MRASVLACALLCVAVAVRGDCDCSGARYGLLRTRADNNDVEINRLFRLADELEAKVGAVGQAPSLDDLKARVDAVTGNDCHDHQFQCSNRAGCVEPLLVCDGHSDCADESDESDHSCEVLTPEGSSWGAAIEHNTCFRQTANHVRIIITSAERSDIIPSQVAIEATTFLYTNSGELSVSSGVGFYNFGTRSLNLRASEGDILDLECHFNDYNSQECHGVLSRGLQGEACGELIFQRE